MNEPRSTPQRITILVHALNGGGTEHVAARMASWWATHGREVTLITLDSKSRDAIEVDPKVRRIGLGLMSDSFGFFSAMWANCRRICAVRSALVHSLPDYVISMPDRMNVLTLIACRGTGLKPIVCERIDVRHHSIGLMWSTLRRWTYPSARAVVVQTEGVRESVQRIAGSAPIHVIPNCVWAENLEAHSVEEANIDLDSTRKWIAAVGRLDRQKGFDLLIAAFADVAEELSEWNLVIVGEGSERKALERLSEQHALSDRIQFAGWVEKPWQMLQERCEMFVLSSRYEGFPNALLEAMSVGLAPIAFDCESGPAEIIRHEGNGLLVSAENVQELVEAMHRLASDEPLRERLSSSCRGVTDDFGVDAYFRHWDALLV